MKHEKTLYLNARIYTMDRDVPRVESLLVANGRVEALGPLDLVQPQAGPDARHVDLDGQTVVPGFHDCHCHILSFGQTLTQIDVSADSVGTIVELAAALRPQVQHLEEGQWLIGRGYDQNALHERRHPTRADLDEITRDHPAVVYHTSGHALTCNSRALHLAGISSSTLTPSGGDIERDAHGEPTGVLKEAPAMDMVSNVIPRPTVEQGADAILRAIDVMASQGITSAGDAHTGATGSLETELAMYRKAYESGKLSGRVTLMPTIAYVAPPGSSRTVSRDDLTADLGTEPDWLAIGPTKIFSDGALTTRTAALREPYADSGSTGILIWETESLLDMIRRAHYGRWQIATHAIGDRAIETVLTCYEAAQAESTRQDCRHRIEHCMILDAGLAQRMRRLGIVAALQPGFIGRLGDAYIQALGAARAAQLMPMELFDLFGLPVAFSSDRPVIPGAPLRGIRSAVDRTTPDGVPLGQHHAITALQAIRNYTSGSAYATHTEADRGSLRRGMLADFTVLSRDLTETPAQEMPRVRVTMTVVEGTETFRE